MILKPREKFGLFDTRRANRWMPRQTTKQRRCSAFHDPGDDQDLHVSVSYSEVTGPTCRSKPRPRTLHGNACETDPSGQDRSANAVAAPEPNAPATARGARLHPYYRATPPPKVTHPNLTARDQQILCATQTRGLYPPQPTRLIWESAGQSLPPKEQRPDKLSGTRDRVSRARKGKPVIWRVVCGQTPARPPKEKAPRRRRQTLRSNDRWGRDPAWCRPRVLDPAVWKDPKR